MHHSFSKIWIHALWATKEQLPFLDESIAQRIYDCMYKQLKELGCPVLVINGMPDHVHALFLLSHQKSVGEVVKKAKVNCANWVNQQEDLLQQCRNQCGRAFGWQGGYAAYSVSESRVEKVYQYIRHQQDHHQDRDFLEEYKAFSRSHDIG